MSKKYGIDRLDKWDKNFKNWEDSDLYYPPYEDDYEDDYEDYDYIKEMKENDSTERKKY